MFAARQRAAAGSPSRRVKCTSSLCLRSPGALLPKQDCPAGAEVRQRASEECFGRREIGWGGVFRSEGEQVQAR